jgi:hypothetical protein
MITPLWRLLRRETDKFGQLICLNSCAHVLSQSPSVAATTVEREELAMRTLLILAVMLIGSFGAVAVAAEGDEAFATADKELNSTSTKSRHTLAMTPTRVVPAGDVENGREHATEPVRRRDREVPHITLTELVPPAPWCNEEAPSRRLAEAARPTPSGQSRPWNVRQIMPFGHAQSLNEVVSAVRRALPCSTR